MLPLAPLTHFGGTPNLHFGHYPGPLPQFNPGGLGGPVPIPGAEPSGPGIHYFGPAGAGVAYPGNPLAGGPQRAGDFPASPAFADLVQRLAAAAPAPQPQPLPDGAQRAGSFPSPDRAHAEGVIAHLVSALGAARDPELKTSLSVALAALQKHVAGIHKEHQQMLAGKVSPRLMHEAYSNGPAHSPGSVL